MSLPFTITIEQAARRIKLRDLRVFVAVVETGGMGRAARSLHTSQPAVSRTISELERMIGVRLLDRAGSAVEPSVAGAALFDCATAICDELRRGLGRIEMLAEPGTGQLRVGCNPFLASSFVAAVIFRFRRRFPRASVELTVAPTSDLLEGLKTRRLDLLVTRDDGARLDGSLRFEHLFDDSFVVAAAAGNPICRRRKIGLTELASWPWVLPPPESVIGRALASAYRRVSLEPPTPAVTAIPLDARIALLASGPFITVFPGSALHLPVRRKDVRALPVSLGVPPARHGIVTRTGRSPEPLAEEFTAFAHDAARGFARDRKT